MVAAVARLMDCAHDSSLLADPLRPSRLLRFTSFGESVPMPSIIQLSSVGGLFEQRFGEGMSFDAADFRFDFGDRSYVRARLLSATAQERVDVRGVVSANLIAGEDDQIGMRFLDGGFDETDRVFAHVRSVLNIGHLQHTEGAVAVESQGHDAHCNAANLDMR